MEETEKIEPFPSSSTLLTRSKDCSSGASTSFSRGFWPSFSISSSRILLFCAQIVMCRKAGASVQASISRCEDLCGNAARLTSASSLRIKALGAIPASYFTRGRFCRTSRSWRLPRGRSARGSASRRRLRISPSGRFRSRDHATAPSSSSSLILPSLSRTSFTQRSFGANGHASGDGNRVRS